MIIVYILDTSPASTSVSPVLGSVIVPVDLNLIVAPGDNNPFGVKTPSCGLQPDGSSKRLPSIADEKQNEQR